MTYNGFTTRLVHHDRSQNKSTGEVHTSSCNSVLFGYDAAKDLCDIFQGKTSGHAYARQSTPSNNALQTLVALTEDSPRSLLFATGMGAITATFLSLLTHGDHLIASRYLFGNTHSLINTLKNFGIQVSLVDTCDSQAVADAIQTNTRIIFTETLANPGTQIPDFESIAGLCQAHNLVFMVDNTLTTGYLFQPKTIGAHLIVSSLTKSFNGHGNVLGGTLVDTGLYDWHNYPNIFPAYRKGDSTTWGLTQVRKKGLRDMGGTLSAESCARISIGVETLALRMERVCSNAQKLAEFLVAQPQVARVYHPSLATHPQHKRAQRLFKGFGGLLSLDLKAQYNPQDFLNNTKIIINATHLGDNRTLALPVAQTIFYEMGPENRKAQGINENMIRCSIGIEDEGDLIDSFAAGLSAL